MTWVETFAIRRGPHEAKSRIIASATGEINWLRPFDAPGVHPEP